ncbi:VCBS domain-containing protein [Halomonas sp. DP5N14-9]|uniref:VCBS domain-containing protein n=1 Tax=Halomonas sp. DP5N14-9 TaxID=2859075 RepID=UPI001C9952B2|nr:VCBS domain-containing protein [Halomonas sp. DP5N14-9]MBY5942182.1 VCBS domain-containing protein [Halomonas sp. DP5N14-9]
MDARLSDAQRQTIREGLADDAELLEVDADENGIEAITAALAGMDQVESVEIFSHGASGQFQLGDTLVGNDTLTSLTASLGQWREALTADADLLLYGCRIGATDAGLELVQGLASATGMDVGASTDDTGHSGLGGDWELERQQGQLADDRGVALAALAPLDGLLADAEPTASLGESAAEVPLGEEFQFTVSVSNASTAQEGYAPFVQLIVPATGKDGAGAEVDDGIVITSASYLGGQLDLYQVTFDANGEAVHPLAKDANGEPITVLASAYGAQAGDTLVVAALPFASLTSDQPSIDVTFTGQLSELADTSQTNGSPDLVIQAMAGFELGNDALSNPEQDPSLIGSAVAFTITPTVIAVEQSLDMSEGDTTTGENYPHSLVTTVRPAGAGATAQTLTDVVITQPVPDNVQVTAIDPGNGTLTSITLASGNTYTGDLTIQALIDSDAFITSYTVTYDNLTEAQSSRVDFYVPETDANGAPVLDPVTGNDTTIKFGAPTGSGVWLPLDDRDRNPDDPDGKVSFEGTGDELSFVAKSITLEKTATLAIDTGTSGLTPGDTLEYQLEMALSDYFAFGEDTQLVGQFVVTDTLGDGQTLEGTPTLILYSGDDATTIDLVVTTSVNADGTTTLGFDIALSIQNALGDQAWLAGDAAFDGVIDAGATRALISYRAVIDDAYADEDVTDHPTINEGDSLGNAAEVDATLLLNPNNLTGDSETDDSSTELTVPTSQVDIAIEGGVSELAPGDEVTFTLRYELVTGDHENFQLIAYLPLPLLDTSGISWTQGTDSGQWSLAADNSWAGEITSVASGPGNAIVFTLADLSTTEASTIALSFTMTVGDQPFADGRSLDVLAESRQTTTLDQTELVTQDVVKVQSVAEPVVTITHGVVSSTNGSVSGTSGSWNAPGSAGAPFTGSITDPAAVDGDVTDIDAGDTLRLATLLENTGGGGAFDVTTEIELPTDLDFVGDSLGSANLTLTLGDGSVLIEGTDYSVSGTTITLLDAGGQATLQAGRDGSASDAAGTNIIVITYDVTVAAAVSASRTLGTTATLTNYASVDGGTDFTPTDLEDDATQQVAAPTITTTFADGGAATDNDSSASHTDGADLVVGESMFYDIVVTLPEGTTQELRVNDLIPPGMALDTSYNGSGYRLITASADSNNLSANFAGSVSVSGLAGSGGTLGVDGVDGVDGQFTFSAAGATGDNDTGNNTFVLRVRLIATNTLNNQQGTEHEHKAGLTYQDVDGDEVNGSTAVDRDVSQPGTGPTTTLVEPTVSIEQALTTPSDPGLGVDADDPVSYTITLSNTSGVDAFDLDVNGDISPELVSPTIGQVTINGSVIDVSGADNPFEITGNATDGYQVSVKSGFDLDLADGDIVTLTIDGTVSANAPNQVTLDNSTSVQWTSLDGVQTSPVVERTGADGEPGVNVINDYRSSDTLAIPVASYLDISRIGGLDSTGDASDSQAATNDVAVGEIIRYRVVALAPEGDSDSYKLQVTLDAGLSFVDFADNRINLALISDAGGLSSSKLNDLSIGDDFNVVGDETSALAQALTLDQAISPTAAQLMDVGILTTATVGGKQVLTFDFGRLVNSETAGANREGISIDFNVRVTNAEGNESGAALGVFAQEIVNDSVRGKSDTLIERIVEPSFEEMTKTVVDFNPAPDDTTGTASVTVAFTQNGGMPAYDVVLTDAFPSGSDYVIDSVVIDGQSYSLGGLPAGVVANATASGIEVTFAQLDPGSEVSVSYRLEVPNDAVVTATAAEARLAWSSLPDDGSFDGFAGSDVGPDGSAAGERTDADGSGGLNDYVLTAGASLGLIEGTLWNDTLSANTSKTPDGDGLAGVSVTLTWDGNNDGDFDDDEDLTFDTVTDANGNYSFGVLPKGSYRISASESLTDADAGELKARIDSGPSDDGSLSLITGAVDGDTTFDADIGYVELNDAPVHTLPASPVSGDEDTDITITGISIADPDALTPGAPSAPAAQNLTTTLSVNNGTLSASGDGGASVSGSGTSELILTGSVDEINAALATLTYTGNANFNGDDTLTLVTSDNGNFGDHPDTGNGTPGESADALTDRDTLAIEVIAVNDEPEANDDSAIAVEAGGRFNIGGIDPNGLVILNDTDNDLNDADPDVLTVVRAGTTAGSLQAVNSDPASPTRIQGTYGTLVISSSGSAEYLLDNNNAAVEALRLSGNTLPETFVYEISDRAGVLSRATITITIEGANDAPVGVDDSGVAIEAGGIGNATAGQDATGNVLTNDTDVDLNGETKAVTGIRDGDELLGSFDEVTGATNVIGKYGTLTIDQDGSYTYVIADDNADVEALAVGDTLSETFSYLVTDAEGLDDIAVLTITIEGAQDNPVATNNTTSAQAPSTDGATPAVDGTGNLIADDDGDDVDADVDTIDQGALAVGAIRPGSETAGGAMTSLGGVSASVDGQYGRLTVNADGSYRYVVDGDNAAVQALAAGATLSETFTYRLIDTAGNPDLAELVVTVTGANDPPSPVADKAIAVEAGGTANATPGDDPSGNVLTNDDDVDGQPLSVDQVRFNTTTVNAGQPLAGRYGTLTLNADGSFSYVVDNSNPAVEALRTANDTLTEVFVYRSVDPLGASTTARLTVTIEGRDDAPVAADNVALAVADSDQGTGRDPSGNVLDNDSDIDAGDQLAVSGARPGTEAAGGALSTPSAGTITLTGQYGTLTLATDGSYSYAVDQSNAEILGLGPLEFRRDVFTYEARDLAGLVDLAELTVFVRGQNQAPVPGTDDGLAVEAGGRDNATPGADAVGNVLDNDSDVDGDINLGVNLLGPNLTVTGVRTGDDPSAGTEGTLGKALKGRYGSLVMEADGSYRYQVDDDNPEVQALRQSGQTLVDVFTYALEDRWGGPASASLTITIDGRNDTPTARDDSGDAVDIGGGASRPDATGNVLPNDTDVDAERYGETQRVTLVAQDGVSAAPGERLAGRYGTLIIEADGSYRYFIDRTNSEVLRASGLGPLLQEVFVYTLTDQAGASDTATLTLTLDIAAPYIPIRDGAGPHFLRPDDGRQSRATLGDVDPVVYVTPEVERNSRQVFDYLRLSHGAQPWLVRPLEMQIPSLASGLGEVPGQYVLRGVALSRLYAEQDQLLLLGRHGRTDLTADGLLADPSLYAPTREQLLNNATGTNGEPTIPTRSSTPGDAQPGSAEAPNRDAADDGRPVLPPGAEWIADVDRDDRLAPAALAQDGWRGPDETSGASPRVAAGFRAQLTAMAGSTAPLRGEQDL